MSSLFRITSAALLATLAVSTSITALAQSQEPEERAEETLSQMTSEEKLAMLQGFLTPRYPTDQLPPNAAVGAGFVFGVPRLGVPALFESDASLGVANMGGYMRRGDEATAMPATLASASTWNRTLVEQAGRVIGAETRAKGFNVLLAGGINLIREPRGGRNFEYYSEDPLLSGVLGGHSVRGVQSQNIISTVKHYLLNAQETGRSYANVVMDEASMRESDLLAFQIAIEIGDPGSVMCSYNKINGEYACENSFLLNDVLRGDWGYKGFVMSDWGAVHSVSIGSGLDQESGRAADGSDGFFGQPLREAFAEGTVTQEQIDRSVGRILYAIYDNDLDEHEVGPSQEINFLPHLEVAQRVAEQGIVLLKNEGDVLPIAPTAQRILVVGGHADVGVPQGGGSSQVWPVGGASLALPIPGEPQYHRRLYMPSAPLEELKAQFPNATVEFDDGSDPVRAAAAARSADIVIVFGEDYRMETHDVPDLMLPDDQNALIEAVADANARTVVVLETGGPVTMPWLEKVPAVLQAWYSGNRGGAAIARVLSGAVNPSGRLPITFPASLAQTPNPDLLGRHLIDQAEGRDLYDIPGETENLDITYPEGSDTGYRWYAEQGHEPLFAFGHGLTYTTFETSAPEITGMMATATVRNAGDRAGGEVLQLYLVNRNDQAERRLVGFERVELQPGESTAVSIAIDPRLLAEWEDNRWVMPAGDYQFAFGESAEELDQPISVRFPAYEWVDSQYP